MTLPIPTCCRWWSYFSETAVFVNDSATFLNCICSYSMNFSTKSLLLMKILSSGKNKLFFAQMLRVQASKNQISLKSSGNAWPGIHIGLNPTVLSGGRNFSCPLVSEVFGGSQHFRISSLAALGSRCSCIEEIQQHVNKSQNIFGSQVVFILGVLRRILGAL